MKKRILCFGDSNTWGNDGAGGRYDEEVRWPCRLQALLGDDYAVIEEGQNGRATVWNDPVEHRMAGLDYLWPCLDTASPIDLVIMMLGTNDLKNYFNVSAQTVGWSIERLIGIIQGCPFGAGGKEPKILLVAPPAINDDNAYPFIFDKAAIDKALELPEVYKAIADQHGCAFLNAQDYTKAGPNDGLHLDEESHIRLGQAMYEAVKAIL